MEREGDALARWLNDHPQSRLARHVGWFLISHDCIPAAQDGVTSSPDFGAQGASVADFGLRLREAYKLEKAARARAIGARKKVRASGFFNPARAYNMRIYLDFRTAVVHPGFGRGRLILPAGTLKYGEMPGDPILRIVPAGSTDAAMLLVIQLAGARQLNRVRACLQCGRWLFARRGIQKFCGQSCQKKFFQSHESWKEKRRLYMRQYRADLRANPKLVVGENRNRGDKR